MVQLLRAGAAFLCLLAANSFGVLQVTVFLIVVVLLGTGALLREK
jgi:hypothetical protein